MKWSIIEASEQLAYMHFLTQVYLAHKEKKSFAYNLCPSKNKKTSEQYSFKGAIS